MTCARASRGVRGDICGDDGDLALSYRKDRCEARRCECLERGVSRNVVSKCLAVLYLPAANRLTPSKVSVAVTGKVAISVTRDVTVGVKLYVMVDVIVLSQRLVCTGTAHKYSLKRVHGIAYDVAGVTVACRNEEQSSNPDLVGNAEAATAAKTVSLDEASRDGRATARVIVWCRAATHLGSNCYASSPSLTGSGQEDLLGPKQA